jgi:hypothetical protein
VSARTPLCSTASRWLKTPTNDAVSSKPSSINLWRASNANCVADAQVRSAAQSGAVFQTPTSLECIAIAHLHAYCPSRNARARISSSQFTWAARAFQWSTKAAPRRAICSPSIALPSKQQRPRGPTRSTAVPRLGKGDVCFPFPPSESASSNPSIRSTLPHSRGDSTVVNRVSTASEPASFQPHRTCAHQANPSSR